MAGINDIVTRGYGTFATVTDIPTRGYTPSTVAVVTGTSGRTVTYVTFRDKREIVGDDNK